MDLTEAEDVEKRRQEYTEAPYKKDLHDPDHHDGVITDLEPDLLECELKWAFESITTNKASGGDGIPGELVQILKDDAVTVLHSLCQHIWKPPPWPQDWKRSVFIPIPKRGHAKACSTDRTLARLSHASRVVLTIPQARLPRYVNRELPDAQAGLRKGRGTREQMPSCAAERAGLEGSLQGRPVGIADPGQAACAVSRLGGKQARLPEEQRQ